MIKKVNYIIFTLITIFCFKIGVLALDTTCTYAKIENKEAISIKFDVKDNKPLNVSSQMIKGSNFSNWSKNNIVEMNAVDYMNKNGECPPYAVYVELNPDIFKDYRRIYLIDEASKSVLESSINQAGGRYMFIRLVSSKYTINFHANNDNVKQTMDPIEVDFSKSFDTENRIENKFEAFGYTAKGWTVYSNGKWFCNVDDRYVYTSDCSEDKKVLLNPNSAQAIIVEAGSTVVDLYMQWEKWVSSSSAIGLNRSDCIRKGYVWNKEGYCNTDNLKYVMCGDAYDIPAQVPSLISFAVNLLKIATPIILIIVSIITLVKAIASTKEDEIKKAQKSLINKAIAAVLVFFVISIVQFVILKVADDDDHKNLTACLTCFLNNDCKTVEYYKTNVFGDYYCTKIGTSNSQLCNNFYKK